MARLRRSLRGSAPSPPTEEERFEKLIGYVEAGNYTETLRQFNMPTYILASFQSDGSNTTKSALEALPTDLLLEVVNELAGNDQIMAALSCKTIAAVVETSTIRKIANITHYVIRTKDPVYPVWKMHRYNDLPSNINVVEWRQYGFRDDSLKNPSFLASDQFLGLRSVIGKWLGTKHRYCQHCRKFRILQKSFWRSFAEYENPGITEEFATKTQEKVKALVEQWNDTSLDQTDPWRATAVCPAHELLKERRGKRVIKAA